MSIITSISLITAFFGGMVALFAPCCITFLLPSYLANIFKNKDKVVLMTLIFGLGIATVLVPTSLGIRAIGQLFLKYHTAAYVIGGIFMIMLGLMELTGKKVTLPMLNLTVDVRTRHNPGSVYLLGIVSGITSSCCTPVLAGILTLSFLSPSFLWAGLAGIAYVTGMVLPLVVMALFLERVNWTRLPFIRGKTVTLGTKRILVTDLFAGVLFMTVGVIFISLALTGRIVMGSEPSVEQTIGSNLMNLVRFLKALPLSEYVFAGFLIGLLIYFLKKRGKL